MITQSHSLQGGGDLSSCCQGHQHAAGCCSRHTSGCLQGSELALLLCTAVIKKVTDAAASVMRNNCAQVFGDSTIPPTPSASISVTASTNAACSSCSIHQPKLRMGLPGLHRELAGDWTAHHCRGQDAIVVKTLLSARPNASGLGLCTLTRADSCLACTEGRCSNLGTG